MNPVARNMPMSRRFGWPASRCTTSRRSCSSSVKRATAATSSRSVTSMGRRRVSTFMVAPM
ncbi:MAG: hypothetical protein D6739_04450 [Nitrospirae bacterium]|nr:MAG: hypothetical protein D6739_04450 [Nitrospirota bacterium]